MKTNSFLTIVLFPLLTLCSPLSWDKIFTIRDTMCNAEFASLSTSDGNTHIFHITSAGNYTNISYAKLLPNGVLLEEKVIGPNALGGSQNFAVQSSSDGKRLLLAYVGLNHSSYDPEGLLPFQVYFTESTNGGDTWSTPIRIYKDDYLVSKAISMLLERDTGRVVIIYKLEYSLGILVREPGKTSFEPEKLIATDNELDSLYIGYTVDKATSKRYIHLLGISGPGKDLIYTQSTNNGRTWTDEIKLVTGAVLDNPASIAINTQAAEGAIYVQYSKGRDIMTIWSKDHGKTWETPLMVGHDIEYYGNIALCGSNGTGVLVSANRKTERAVGFVRFSYPYGKNFINAVYPLPSMQNNNCARYPKISCEYIGNGQHAVVLMAKKLEGGSLFVAHGIIYDDDITQKS